MSKMASLSKGTMTSHLPLATQLCLPTSRFHSTTITSQPITTQIQIPTNLNLIRPTSIPNPRPHCPNPYHRTLPRIYMQEIALLPIGAFLPVIKLLANLHPVYQPLIIIPVPQPPVLRHHFLPVWRRLPQVLCPMGKSARLSIPAVTVQEFQAHSGLEKDVACPFV